MRIAVLGLLSIEDDLVDLGALALRDALWELPEVEVFLVGASVNTARVAAEINLGSLLEGLSVVSAKVLDLLGVSLNGRADNLDDVVLELVVELVKLVNILHELFVVLLSLSLLSRGPLLKLELAAAL